MLFTFCPQVIDSAFHMKSALFISGKPPRRGARFQRVVAAFIPAFGRRAKARRCAINRTRRVGALAQSSAGVEKALQTSREIYRPRWSSCPV